jgi:hypothetical protein
MHVVSLQPQRAHPDIRLDVLHDMADVERAVRVWQSRRDEQLPAVRRHPKDLMLREEMQF